MAKKLNWERLARKRRDRSEREAACDRWMSPPASEKQVQTLCNLGYEEQEVKKLTISQATSLISLCASNGWRRMPLEFPSGVKSRQATVGATAPRAAAAANPTPTRVRQRPIPTSVKNWPSRYICEFVTQVAIFVDSGLPQDEAERTIQQAMRAEYGKELKLGYDETAHKAAVAAMARLFGKGSR